MVDWPTGLPAEGLSGIGDQGTGAKIRSAVDQGPPIQRKRYTKNLRNVDIPITLTEAERAIFEEWYAVDLDLGVLSFNWKDPHGGATKSFRFRSNDAPKWTGSGGGSVKRWTATLELEIW